MAAAGNLLLAVALVSALGGAAASLGATATAGRVPSWCGVVLLRVAAAATIGATLVLAQAFAVGDYSLIAVVDHSREALGTWDRVMGLWGGMAGSLLLFTTATAVFAAVGLGRTPPAGVAVANGIVASLIAIGWALADPFATLAIPALDGVGLTPILEHWAMRVHPPIVYAGLTALIVPACRTIGAMPEGLDASWWRTTRLWLLASWLLLGAGMLLGSVWAYAELGWGGYWAWDPIENAALLPWLAATVALHGGPHVAPRLSALSAVAPYLIAMLGATLTRSGATMSVHAFAEARDIGRSLTMVLVVVVAISVVLVLRVARRTVERVPSEGRARVMAQVLVGTVFGIVLLGTSYPLLRGWFGGDRLAIEGWYFSTFVAPITALALVALMGRGRWPSATSIAVACGSGVVLVAAGWREPMPIALASLGIAAVAVSGRAVWERRRGSDLAHLGLALMIAGMAATATGDQVTVPVGVGETVVVAGHEVTLQAIDLEPGPTDTSSAVVARVTIDGHPHDASLVAHPDRGVLLAESTLRSRPTADVQVILRNAADDVALLVVNVAPFQQVVWLGATVMLAGGLWSAVAAQASSLRPRRARWLSSNEPSVELGGAGADGASAVGGGAGSGPSAS
jgi:cytochrome c-type biogenesis protein CcmF